ncbi:MAG: hypothetical protein WBP82_01020 [Leuconostoc mesenteroides]
MGKRKETRNGVKFLSMVLRLDPIKDREFLEKRVDKKVLKNYFSNREDRAHNPNRLNELEMTRMTESSIKNEVKGRLKYGNHKTTDIESGKVFDSKFELECYRMLLNLQDAKLISELKSTEIVTLVINGHTFCDFEIDFSFVWCGVKRYADAKSKATLPQGFRLKQKAFEILFETELYLIFRNKKSILDDIKENGKFGYKYV